MRNSPSDAARDKKAKTRSGRPGFIFLVSKMNGFTGFGAVLPDRGRSASDVTISSISSTYQVIALHAASSTGRTVNETTSLPRLTTQNLDFASLAGGVSR